MDIKTLQDRITKLEERLDYLHYCNDGYPDEEIDIYLELEELKEQLNFAWQDDELAYNYALELQEFNADGSLKYY